MFAGMAVTFLLGCSPSDSAGPLVNTSWQLLALVPHASGSVTAVPDPEAFTLTLRGDGAANLRIDCNRGSSRWLAALSLLDEKPRDADFSGQLTLAPILPVPVACQKPSLAQRVSLAVFGPHEYMIANECLFMDKWGPGDSLIWRSSVGHPDEVDQSATLARCCSSVKSLRTRC